MRLSGLVGHVRVAGAEPERAAAPAPVRPMNAEELAAIRERHHRMDGARIRCPTDNQPWPCDAAKQAAHIDALTAKVEAANPLDGPVHSSTSLSKARVLAILRGEA